MNCTEIRNQIREKIERGPSLRDDPVLMQHLRECDLCRHVCSDMLLHRSLQQMPVDQPRAGFAEEAVRKAVNQNRRRLRRNFFLGFSAAAVMLIAIGATLILERLNPPAFFAGSPHTSVIMPVGGEKMVRIVVETAAARSNATFTIEFSSTVALRNYPNRRRLEWQTDLPRGRNLLELPLVLKEKSRGYLHIRYTYNGSQKETRIQVQPGDSGGMQNPITS